MITRVLRYTLLTLVVTAHAFGCQSVMEPFDIVPSNTIRSELSILPPDLAWGSSTTLRVETTNHGKSLVSARSGCAPGLGFQIKRPDGVVVDPYAGMVFTCPRLDSQDLEPGETDVVTWEYTPPVPGRYEVIGGLLVDGRIVGPSTPQTFRVR